MSPPFFPQSVPWRAVHADETESRLGESMLEGNQAVVHEEPDAAREVLLGAIERATDHINLDAALLHAPGMQAGLLERLVAQCRRGVRLQILTHPPAPSALHALTALREAGATLNQIRPPRGALGWVARRFGRLQRQLAVVDGHFAWCGPGLCTGDVLPRGPHVCLQGSIALRVQRIYLQSWHASGAGVRLPQANFFPPANMPGSLRMGIWTPAGTDGGHDGCALVGAIEKARTQVFISMVQRVPARPLRQAMLGAAARGVNVSVLLHGTLGGRGPWTQCCRELVRSRVWVYQAHDTHPFPPHAIVDGVWSCIALNGGTGWHSARVGGAAAVIVVGTTFGEAFETASRNTLSHARLLNAHAPAGLNPLQNLLSAVTGQRGWWHPSSAQVQTRRPTTGHGH